MMDKNGKDMSRGAVNVIKQKSCGILRIAADSQKTKYLKIKLKGGPSNAK